MSYQVTVKAEAYATDAGPVVKKSMIALPECTIDPTEPSTRVVFMVALLANSDNWCLFYHQGGDWASFGDGDENSAEMLSDWMPDAIRACVAAVEKRIGESAADDMEWFTDWANAAEETLNTADEEDSE